LGYNHLIPGLSTLAVGYYEKVLAAAGPYEKEAAYNLALLYVSSGSNEIAQTIYKKHLSF
jgi:Tfp pilus assembly protein PilF